MDIQGQTYTHPANYVIITPTGWIMGIENDAKSKAEGYYKESMFNMYCDGYTAGAFEFGKKMIEEIFNEPTFYIPRQYFIP